MHLYASFLLDSNFGLDTAILFAAFLALIVTAVTVAFIATYYAKKNRSPSYPLRDFTNLELTDRQDVFTGKFVTKTVIRSNNRKR